MRFENEIWERLIEGDNEALQVIYQHYFGNLYTYGMRVHNDPSLIKDSIQEVFIDLIQRRSSLKATGTIHLYLFKALRHQIMQELRARNRKIEIAKSLTSDISVADSTIEQQIENQETYTTRQKVIQNALGKLSAHQREAIFLRFTQGLEYEDISRIIGIDLASARTLVYRSLKKVKELIGGNSFILFLYFCNRHI